jgi:hypothetical protein
LLLHERLAWQGWVVPSHAPPIGTPPVVEPHDEPETTLPSQKHGAFGAPTTQTRGEHVRTPAALLPCPSSFAAQSRPRPTTFA